MSGDTQRLRPTDEDAQRQRDDFSRRYELVSAWMAGAGEATSPSAALNTLDASKRRLEALYTAVRVLATASTLAEAAPRVLKVLGESEGWHLGNLWMVDAASNVLHFEGSWYTPGFDAVTLDALHRPMVFPPGYGLLGSVWSSGRPVWLADVSSRADFVRQDMVTQQGLRGAFFFPIWNRGKVLGVIEFFSREAREPDLDQIEIVTSISHELGQFVEHKQAEEALRWSHAIVRAQEEASIEGYLVVDETRAIVRHNRRFVELWAVPEPIMATRDDRQLFAYMLTQVADPEAFARRVEALYQQALEESHEEVRLADGRVLERFTTPAISPRGAYVGRIWFYRDVTERFVAEERLRRNQIQLADAQKIAHLGSFEWDKGSDEMVWSDELRRIAGIEAPESPSFERLLERVHPEDQPPLRAQLEQLRLDHLAFALDCRLLQPRGELRHVHIEARLVEEPGKPMRVVGTVQDITERKQLEEALKAQNERLLELDRLKNIFVNAVTHELRTPLTSMRGYIEFLEDGLGGPLTDKEREFIGYIRRSEERLERLVTDLLDFARLEAGTFRLNTQPEDLGAKLLEVVGSMTPQATDAGVELSVVLPPEPIELEMDAQRIGQVLANLIDNAIKFTQAGGSVRVAARVEADEVVCEVQDTGIGIAPDDIPRLFQRFGQLEAGRKRGGTGLGLNISMMLVEAHHGRIGVTSTPGAGSVFWFRLPRRQAVGPAP